MSTRRRAAGLRFFDFSADCNTFSTSQFTDNIALNGREPDSEPFGYGKPSIGLNRLEILSDRHANTTTCAFILNNYCFEKISLMSLIFLSKQFSSLMFGRKYFNN